MDGVLVDTEHLWDEVREELTAEWGGRYTPEAQQAMMGMSSHEWSRYLHEVVGLREQPDDQRGGRSADARALRDRAPGRAGRGPGGPQARRGGLPLALASSSNRELIDAVLRGLGLTELFEVTVSSEEVDRGKPAPDVYLEAAARLGVDPRAAPRSRTPRAGSGRPARPGCG